MIRINRLIKKDAIFEILHLPHVARIEIKRRKAKQKDPKVVRLGIYLTRSQFHDDRAEFINVMRKALEHPDLSNEGYSTIRSALHNGFIKESTYNDLGIPVDKKYREICQRYNQAFFDTF